jgi:hypothetical protein
MNLQIGLNNLVNEYSLISQKLSKFELVLNFKLKQYDIKHKVYIKYGLKQYVILKIELNF